MSYQRAPADAFCSFSGQLSRDETRLGNEALLITTNLAWVPRGVRLEYTNSFHTGGHVLIGPNADIVDRRFALCADARAAF